MTTPHDPTPEALRALIDDRARALFSDLCEGDGAHSEELDRVLITRHMLALLAAQPASAPEPQGQALSIGAMPFKVRDRHDAGRESITALRDDTRTLVALLHRLLDELQQRRAAHTDTGEAKSQAAVANSGNAVLPDHSTQGQAAEAEQDNILPVPPNVSRERAIYANGFRDGWAANRPAEGQAAHAPTQAEVEALRCDGVRAETAGFYNGWHSALDAVLALYTRKGSRPMAIDANVAYVELNEDGSGVLHLCDRVPEGSRGQSRLRFASAPYEVTALNGLPIWGGAGQIMLGNVEIARREGYTRIVFHDQDVLRAAVKAHHAKRRQEAQP